MIDSTNIELRKSKYEDLRKYANNQIYTLPKYMIIRKIPLVFLGFLILCLILIHVTVCNPFQLSKHNKKMLSKFNYLLMGLVIAIGHVYLSSLRTEYKQKIYTLWKYKQELDDFDGNFYNPKYI